MRDGIRGVQGRFLALILGVGLVASASAATAAINGAAEFKEHCAACHANGGNLINPAKTLTKADREKHGIKTGKDLIRIMRKPGPGMTAFDEKTLPEKEAQKIADYILKNFK